MLNDKEYHVTSLRKDLISFGRSAFVDVALSLNEDVKRRDFTINSLYLDTQGNLIDLLNGKNDIDKRKLVFIGDPIKRIEEDNLRIIRFCRFSGNFNNNITENLKKEIISRVPNIINLSNKRIRNEIDKILLVQNCHKCLQMMTKLSLDKYLLMNKNNYLKFNIHNGFVINNFKIINFIKFNATNVIQNEKLDLISVTMIHLYGENNIDMIINRFDLNKRKIKFLYFIRQIINLKKNIKNNFLDTPEVREKQIKVLQLIWKFRYSIISKKQGLFKKDRIPFNWYKFGFLHIFSFEKIKEVDFFEIKWPIFPLDREEIMKSQKTITFNQLEKLFFKAEDFWVNNNFKSSPTEILNFLKNR
tara:strand:- start:436 stop:1512 length:1077 start_codon:yes stop_codon:yes gene_type:complete